MEAQFCVKEQDYEKLKEIVRKYNSLRFTYEPQLIGSQYYIYIDGEVTDYNSFNQEKYNILGY